MPLQRIFSSWRLFLSLCKYDWDVIRLLNYTDTMRNMRSFMIVALNFTFL